MKKSFVVVVFIFFVCVVTAVLEAQSFPDFSNGGGDDWLDGYYRQINVSNSAGMLTDHWISLTLTTAVMGNPYANLKADGSDLRFSASSLSDPDNEFFYWIESWDNTGNSTVWIKVPSLPIGNSLVYMYYGNVSATSSSSLSNIFGSGGVGFWPFSEASGVTTADRSGSGNTGTLTDGPSWVDGRFGKALSFDGTNDYLNIPDDSSLKFGTSQDFSIECWVYPVAGSGAYCVVKGLAYIAHGGNQQRYSIEGNMGSGRWWPYIYIADGSATGKNDWYSSSKGFILDQWSHLVATFDRDGLASLWKNGALLSSGDISSIGNCDNADPLRIGTERDGGSWFKGKVDNFRIYNRILSDNEIASRYANPEPIVDSPSMEIMPVVISSSNWTSLVSVGTPVARGQSIPYVSFNAQTTRLTASFKRLRVDKYTGGSPSPVPDDKIEVQVWCERNGNGFWDVADDYISHGYFNDGVVYIDMKRYTVDTTPETFYIVYKLSSDIGGGQRAGVGVAENTYLEFEGGLTVLGVPP